MGYIIYLSSIDVTALKKLSRSEKDGKILRRYHCIWMVHEALPKRKYPQHLV